MNNVLLVITDYLIRQFSSNLWSLENWGLSFWISQIYFFNFFLFKNIIETLVNPFTILNTFNHFKDWKSIEKKLYRSKSVFFPAWLNKNTTLSIPLEDEFMDTNIKFFLVAEISFLSAFFPLYIFLWLSLCSLKFSIFRDWNVK